MTTLLAAGGWVPAFIAQALAFTVLAFLIFKFGVPVIRKAVDDQGDAVRDEFARLEREFQEAGRGVADIRQRLAGIQQESQRRLQAALDEGARMKKQAVDEATAQAAAELAKAKRDVQIERDKAVLELRMEVVRRTVEVTERAVAVLVDEPLHGRMVDKYLGEIEKAARP